MLRKISLYIIFLLQALSFSACSKENLDLGSGTETPNADTKVLIVYYSWSGTTKAVAERMQRMLHSDIYEIVPAVAYPTNGNDTHYRAVEERESGKLPELKGALPDLSKYQVVLLGGPVWSDYMSTPLMSFMAQTDFAGKRVAGFRTDAGTPGKYDSEFRRMAKQSHADVVEQVLGLSHVRSFTADELDRRINEWFKVAGAVRTAAVGNRNGQ